MTSSVISVEHLTKQYDLGVIGTGTLSRDLNRWWARVRHLPDPYTRIGQPDAFARIGESILALDDVSFTVNQGEALGIIGRNGAGKSTLLKILSRVTAPTSGVVKVRGRIGSLLEVGTGFHPELTGRENVYLNGAILGMKKAEVTRKFDEIVAFAGVEKFIDTPVKRYSSGMYVRLAFAVAAHLDPEILIVDEVLAVGDAEFQKKCLGKMGDVAGEGRTVLFVSHNMLAIKNLCNTSMLLDKGQLVYLDNTYDVVNEYLSKNNILRVFDTGHEVISIGDDNAKIKRIRIIDIKGKTVNHLTIDNDFGIEITYQIVRSGSHKPVPNIYIRTRSDEPVFQSIDTIHDNIFNKGSYKSVVWIPAYQLNNGTYIVTIALSTLNPSVNHAGFDIQFDIEDVLSSPTRGDYMYPLIGVSRPLLSWDTKKI